MLRPYKDEHKDKCKNGELFGGFFEFLQFFAGLEAHGFAGRDVDFFAGARIAADAGFARACTLKTPKRRSSMRCAAAQSVLQGFENGFDRLFRLGAAHARLGDDGIHDDRA